MSKSSDVALRFPAFHGVRALFFAENWEDKIDFEPFIYVDVTRYMEVWLKMVNCYQQFKNSDTSYIDYYSALAKFRGSESHFDYACAFHTFSIKKQGVDIIP